MDYKPERNINQSEILTRETSKLEISKQTNIKQITMSTSSDPTVSSVERRRQSSIPDPEFIEAFKQYRNRERRRRSTFVKTDQTIVDIATTNRNIALIVTVIAAVMLAVVIACVYIKTR